MAINAEQLNIILAARDKEFTKAMERSQRRVERFATQSKKQLSATTKSMNTLGSAAKKLAPLLAAALSVRAINQASNMAVEISNLSRLAGVSTTEFQKFAVAARTMGIEQQKAADILKDMNDRVGDFLQTGGGPMKDFFENVAPLVGVTADQFRNLSGPDALALFVDTLERAGASQQDFTFYMEAMASDATALIPILRDNASGLRSIGDEAEAAGRIMDEKAIKATQDFQNKLASMRSEIDANLLNSMYSLKEEIQFLYEFARDYGVPAFESLVSAAAFAAESIEFVTKAIRDLRGLEGGVDLFSSDDVADLENQISKLRERRGYFQERIQGVLSGRELSEIDPSSTDARRISSYSQQISELSSELETANFMLAEMNKLINEGGDDSDPIILAPIEVSGGGSGGTLTPLGGGISPIRQATAEVEELEETLSRFDEFLPTLESSLENMFMSIVDGTVDAKEAFKQMATEVIKELYRVYVVQQLVSSITSLFGGGSLAPSSSPRPQMRPRASGGPAYAGQSYMTGEHGRELFVPSVNGRILSAAQTNNAMSGGSEVTVVQNINVSTGVQQTVRSEIRTLMPQIADAAKSAVADAKRRGGSYGRAMS